MRRGGARRRCEVSVGVVAVVGVVSTYLLTLPVVEEAGRPDHPRFVVEAGVAGPPPPPPPPPPPSEGGAVREWKNASRRCGGRVFVVHWSHVPKAAGTAFVQVAKRIACRKNEALFGREVRNPCCERRLLCLKDGRCDTTVFGGCPLVLGVGMHAFNGARLFDVGCEGCGERWLDLAVERSLLKGAFSRPPSREHQVGKRVNATLELESHRRWPVERRVEFYARLGVSPATLAGALRAERPVAEREIPRLTQLAEAAACARPPPRRHTAEYRKEWRDFFANCDGSHSMTVLRHPFFRATSAFFYRGHSPNYDVFDLRPGLWLPPSVRYTGTTLHEYFFLPEYRNLLTKFFGDSTGCRDAASRGCSPASARRPRAPRDRFTCRCAVFGGCPAYRNASLGARHVDAALDVLARHAFVGFQETPVASALLAARLFGLTDDDVALDPSRQSKNLKARCSPARVMRLDPTACRAAFRASHLDVLVFEAAHRRFCDQLRALGLDADSRVAADLANASFCGPRNFSSPDHVCGPLETDRAYADLADARRKCRRATGPRWWRDKFGFFHSRPDLERRRRAASGRAGSSQSSSSESSSSSEPLSS